jgi:thiamine transport system ATP-binding protein
MAHLVLKHLTKRFGEITAVSDLTVTLQAGELLTLVGPSGCGKTTTLRLIAGFESPDGGEIELDGRSLLKTPPETRGVGIVFQNYALFPHMNVFDNIAYGLKFMKERPDKRQRVRELLELMELEGLEKRRPDELSAGQQQRVALARALAPNPKILLLDEPLSALDSQLRERLRLEIKRIQRELRVTTLYVTHDQEEALAISDHVAVMNQGQLEQIGTPWEIYHQPASLFVARFVGRGNLLQGRVIRLERGVVELQLEDGQSVRLTTPALYSLTADVRVYFLVRPERLRLDQQSENGIRGMVRAVEFLGDAVLLHVESGNQQWQVKVSNPDDGLLQAVDREVTLGFSRRDGKILLP